LALSHTPLRGRPSGSAESGVWWDANIRLQTAGIRYAAYLSIGVTRCLDRPAATPRYGTVSGRIGVWLCTILHMNFYEKALFVKVDVATALWLR
jgi:hypothetical protein